MPDVLKPYLTRAAFLGLCLALIVVILDQASKAWIVYGLNLPSHQSIEILPFLSLTMVYNKGVSFGMLGSSGWGRWALSLFQVSVACGLIVWLRRITSVRLAMGLGLIIGGAFGNAIDRIRIGAVVDFIDVSNINLFGLKFPWVFNIADSAITIGVIFWIYDMFLTRDEATIGETPTKPE